MPGIDFELSGERVGGHCSRLLSAFELCKSFSLQLLQRQSSTPLVMATFKMNRTMSGRINKAKKRRPSGHPIYTKPSEQMSSLSSNPRASLLSAGFRPQTASHSAFWHQVPRSAGSDCSSSADELTITVSRLTPSSQLWASSASSDSSATSQQDYSSAPREALAALLRTPISFVSAAGMTNSSEEKDRLLRKKVKKRSQKQAFRDRLVRITFVSGSFSGLERCFDHRDR